jgi:glycosidase
MLRIRTYGILLLILLVLTGCSKNAAEGDNMDTAAQNSAASAEQDAETAGEETGQAAGTSDTMGGTKNTITTEYQYNHELQLIDDNYRTYYEVFLYSFYDSNEDGIGDINGLISKLDYINDGDPSTDTDLGFTGIWLMPVMPSDTYHKYDVKDYYSIDPQYGTMEDFKRLLAECDRRGIKVILDLVLNHSSSEHPWFRSALKSLAIEPCGQQVCTHEELCREHNPYVDYYNFIEGKPEKGNYVSTGIGNWYYEAVFSSNMPDFNLANKSLRKDIEDIMTYWLDLGVDGFRLDAALHYYSNDTEKNTEVLSWLNNFLKGMNTQYYMVAEVWTNFSSYVKYYASGIDSVFNFAFAAESGKIAETINLSGLENSGKAFGDAMLQVQNGLKRISSTAIDAPFFTNHDTARAAGFFSGNAEKTKFAGGLNLMMGGNAFVYYGEELGMSGSGKDENKRAPMYWSETGRTGMTTGPKNMDPVTHSFGSYEEQSKDPLSIFNYYKRAIRLRNENPEIARGEITLINNIPDPDICALIKTYEDSKIIMLYNFSETEKTVTLSRTDYGYEGIRGYLSANYEEATLKGETITLPPYSIVLLK